MPRLCFAHSGMFSPLFLLSIRTIFSWLIWSWDNDSWKLLRIYNRLSDKIENINTYSLKYNIGQIILSDTDDDNYLIHPYLLTSKVNSGNHWKCSITTGSTLLHVTKPDSIYFDQKFDLKLIGTVDNVSAETLATIYHEKRNVPIVKHLCPNVSRLWYSPSKLDIETLWNNFLIA